VRIILLKLITNLLKCKMEDILKRYCEYKYSLNNNTSKVYQYKWLEFNYFVDLNIVSMSYNEYSSVESFEFKTVRKLLTFFESLT